MDLADRTFGHLFSLRGILSESSMLLNQQVLLPKQEESSRKKDEVFKSIVIGASYQYNGPDQSLPNANESHASNSSMEFEELPKFEHTFIGS